MSIVGGAWAALATFGSESCGAHIYIFKGDVAPMILMRHCAYSIRFYLSSALRRLSHHLYHLHTKGQARGKESGAVTAICSTPSSSGLCLPWPLSTDGFSSLKYWFFYGSSILYVLPASPYLKASSFKLQASSLMLQPLCMRPHQQKIHLLFPS